MKKKALLSSILSIVLCLTMISGATFALFTDSETVNIAVTAGKVDIDVTVQDLSTLSYPGSVDVDADWKAAVNNVGTFTNGGTATYVKDGETIKNQLTLSLITPGDAVKLNLKIANNSDVKIKYRVKVGVVDGLELFQGLKVNVSGVASEYKGTTYVSDWSDVLNPIAGEDKTIATVPVVIEFPYLTAEEEEALGVKQNDLMGKSTTIYYTVEAVQGNGDTVNVVDDEKTTYVYSATDLQIVAQNVKNGETYAGKTIKLMSDIDLAGVEWMPIGSASAPFKGTFDGAKEGATTFAMRAATTECYTISNLNVTLDPETTQRAALFGQANNAVIKNVKVHNVTATALARVAAVVAGAVGTTVENCHVSGDINLCGYQYVGAIVGNGYVTIKNCSVAGTAENPAEYTVPAENSYGKMYMGGIAGWLGEGNTSIIGCSAEYVNMTTNGCVGGITGLAHYGNTIELCAALNININANSAVQRPGTVGIIAGACGGTETSPSYFNGNVYEDVVVTDAGVAVETVHGAEPMGSGVAGFGIINDKVDGKWAILDVEDLKNAVAEGGEIKLYRNLTFDKNSAMNSSGSWYEGIYYEGDESFTIDLNGKTITCDSAVNDYLMLFKNDGEKANVITFKNGTIEAASSAFCAICTSTTSTQKITINLENVNVIGNNSNGAVIKIRGGAELNVKSGTVITGQNSYVGIECFGANTVTNIYDGAQIYQNGTSSYVGSLVGVSNNATVNVYGGSGTSTMGCFIAMTSGGTINVSGGTWIANTNGAYANGNQSALIAQSANGASSVINVTGGTFMGGYNCYGAAVGDAQINISGGNFNADPSTYVVSGYSAAGGENAWTVLPVVKSELQTIADGLYYDGADTYYVTNAKGLVAVAKEVNKAAAQAPNIFDGKNVKLMNDIDLNNVEWTPIGDYGFNRTVFRGTFDGQGYTVSNFKITTISGRPDKVTEASYGLFGNVNGTIKNLTVENATVENGGRFAAALVGRMKGGLIENCNVINASVKINHWQVGGIVGQLNAGDIKSCSISDSTITGYAGVGAIAGFYMEANESTIENCTVKNCALVQNGSFGAGYDGMFAGILGAVNNSGTTVYINNCKVENTTIKGVASSDLYGYVKEGAVVIVNGFQYLTDGVWVKYDAKGNAVEYGLTNANGFLWVEAQADNFFSGKTVKMLNDIDMDGVDMKPIRFWNPGYQTTFDGQGYTIYNLNITSAEGSSNQALFNGTVNVKNVTVDGALVKGYGYVAVLGGTVYGNFENCHVKNAEVIGGYWQVGVIVAQWDSGNISNCSVVDSKVTGPAAVGVIAGIVNEAGGVRKVENCVVKNCEVVMNYGFGGNYDDMFGAVVGLINIENSTVYMTGCTVEGNTVKGVASNALYGEVESSTQVITD